MNTPFYNAIVLLGTACRKCCLRKKIGCKDTVFCAEKVCSVYLDVMSQKMVTAFDFNSEFQHFDYVCQWCAAVVWRLHKIAVSLKRWKQWSVRRWKVVTDKYDMRPLWPAEWNNISCLSAATDADALDACISCGENLQRKTNYFACKVHIIIIISIIFTLAGIALATTTMMNNGGDFGERTNNNNNNNCCLLQYFRVVKLSRVQSKTLHYAVYTFLFLFGRRHFYSVSVNRYK